eukprot:CAMPEP_0195068848 /NCGR_PEP_ID=MMETSP0448-20130528/13381_1 /TAXON_ID=66468 /ORGANISM="Heterocapsa triquestra, Strain CCMP 448" /LENGTH=154 /DNA_ID=CAMNT_0040100393 /DNA_START=377 /DNA_END=838 /DNA_ORIENTATION=+
MANLKGPWVSTELQDPNAATFRKVPTAKLMPKPSMRSFQLREAHKGQGVPAMPQSASPAALSSTGSPVTRLCALARLKSLNEMGIGIMPDMSNMELLLSPVPCARPLPWPDSADAGADQLSSGSRSDETRLESSIAHRGAARRGGTTLLALAAP